MRSLICALCLIFSALLMVISGKGASGGWQALAEDAPAKPAVQVMEDGTIHASSIVIPESSYLSEESRAALKHSRNSYQSEVMSSIKACPKLDGVSRAKALEIRKCQAAEFYKTSGYKAMRDRYDVTIKGEEIGGVYVEIFTPTDGIASAHKNRVLVNVHGGGFVGGARTSSHIESIPLASVGKIKVISIDYRQAPEYTFPAASEDVAAVFRELFKSYSPKNIGLYGCSAGGWLTAQSMAWFVKEGLPLPGAVGMFGGAALRALASDRSKWVRGDAAHIENALTGRHLETLVEPNPYYKGFDRRNPLASPGDYDEVMAKFPPSLLISGGRDGLLSEVLVTHAQLVRLGVEADLHVWEGMGHCFQVIPDFPESREAYNVIIKFFDSHLGK